MQSTSKPSSKPCKRPRLPPPAPKKLRKEQHYQGIQLSNLAKQGNYPMHQAEQCRYNVTHGQEIRQKLHVHPKAINPQTDIAATGQFTLYVRTVESLYKGGPHTSRVACLYKPDGTCPYTLPAPKLELLYSRYELAKAHNPTQHAQLTARSFAEDLYQLLARYNNDAPCHATPTRRITRKGKWALPQGVYQAIVAATGATAEPFSSPQNVQSNLQTYYSPVKADTLFGSRGDAHACKWTGSSVAVPPPDTESVTYAVKHAIESAKAQSAGPTYTILAIPALADTTSPGYIRLLRDNAALCRALIKIPATHMKYMASAPFMLDSPTQHKSAGDTLLVEVGNAQGMKMHSIARDAAQESTFCSNLAQALNAALPPHKQVTTQQLRTFCHAATHLTPSLATTASLSLAPEHARNPMTPANSNSGQLRPTKAVVRLPLPPAVYKPPPLLYNWRDLTYTDGSFIRKAGKKSKQPMPTDRDNNQSDSLTAGAPRIGASVYIPNPDGDCHTVAILPAEEEGERFDDTINRAELIAVWQAINMGCTHILTDSLSVICQLHNIIYRPQEIYLSFHRHAALLQAVRDSIAEAPHPIRLYKVKSHIGVVGNERADQIATEVAKGLRIPDIHISTPSNNRRAMYWPHYPQPDVSVCSNSPHSQPKPIEDISTLATLAHQGHKLGGSNTQALYYSAAAAIEAETDPVSHAFLKSPHITCQETSNALKVRT